MQIAHAGRKGSTSAPWLGGKKVPPEQGGWEPVAPSTEPFDKDYPMPRALTAAEIREVVDAFHNAAERAFAVGFEVLEIHAAHGYLLHEFLSPLSNFRQDEFGGSFENRIRIVLQVVEAVREVWPARLPLFVRVSTTDWKEGGWDLDQTVELSKRLKPAVDLIDVSSGGVVPGVQIPVEPGYQVGFAEAIRKHAAIATGAVGMITEPNQADAILKEGKADLVILARELLRDPYWPRRAAPCMVRGGQTVYRSSEAQMSRFDSAPGSRNPRNCARPRFGDVRFLHKPDHQIVWFCANVKPIAPAHSSGHVTHRGRCSLETRSVTLPVASA